jgi:hypothetical protein
LQIVSYYLIARDTDDCMGQLRVTSFYADSDF